MLHKLTGLHHFFVNLEFKFINFIIEKSSKSIKQFLGHTIYIYLYLSIIYGPVLYEISFLLNIDLLHMNENLITMI